MTRDIGITLDVVIKTDFNAALGGARVLLGLLNFDFSGELLARMEAFERDFV